MARKTRRQAHNATARRAKEIRAASRSAVQRLVSHHLSRCLDESIPECAKALRTYRRNSGTRHYNGRTLAAWLRDGCMHGIVSSRAFPAIEGLRALGRQKEADGFSRDLHDWEARCNDLAEANPKAMPVKRDERRRFVRARTDAAEALLVSALSMVGRYAKQAGVDLQTSAALNDLLRRLVNGSEGK